MTRLMMLFALTLGAAGALAAPPDPADFQVLSTALSPRVAFALQQTPAGITLLVDVGTFRMDGSGTELTIGLSAVKALTLTDKDARISRADGVAHYTFTVPNAALVVSQADWTRVRMGMAVTWTGGPSGQDRQRERFRHLGSGSSHRGLSPDPSD